MFCQTTITFLFLFFFLFLSWIQPPYCTCFNVWLPRGGGLWFKPQSTGSLMEIMIPNAKREMQAQMHNNARMQDEVASCNTQFHDDPKLKIRGIRNIAHCSIFYSKNFTFIVATVLLNFINIAFWFIRSIWVHLVHFGLIRP